MEERQPAAYQVSDVLTDGKAECRLDHPAVWTGFDQHFELEVNFILQGSLEYLHRGDLERLESGTMAAFWAAYPHQIVATHPDTRFYYMHIPFTWFMRWRLPDAFRHALLTGWFSKVSCAEEMTLHTALFRRWSEDLDQEDPEHQEAVELELKALLLRIAQREKEQPQDVSDASTPPAAVSLAKRDKMIRMVQFMGEHFLESLSVSDVASSVDLHPNYASTLFQTHGGTTILAFMTRLRVVHAQSLLTTTDDTVLDIAFASGFGSACAFYRAFKKICGLAPQDYRIAMRKGGAEDHRLVSGVHIDGHLKP